jgi:hypothetical protein
MHFSNADLALIFSLLGGWLASLLLAIANPYLICILNFDKRTRLIHLVIFGVYLAGGLMVCTRWPGFQSPIWVIPIFAVPILSISHFVFLVWKWRQIRLRKQRAEAAEPVTSTRDSALR